MPKIHIAYARVIVTPSLFGVRNELSNRMRSPSEKGPNPANHVQIKKKEENERRRELRILVILYESFLTLNAFNKFYLNNPWT